MKLKSKYGLNTNEEENWAVVDTDGKVIEKYRHRTTAVNNLQRHNQDCYCQCKVVKVR